MVLVGNLKDLHLANIIQLNCMESNIAKVSVSSHEGTGYLYFAEGQIVHAEFSPYIGERAVFEMLSLNDGQFKVEAGVQAPAHTIKRPWNSVVLDSLRELDEKREQSLPSPQKISAMLSGQKGIKNIFVLDHDGKLVEGELNEKIDSDSLAFIWYKIKKILTFFDTGSINYTFLKDHWGYLFIIEFQLSLIFIETDLNIVVDDFVKAVSKMIKNIK